MGEKIKGKETAMPDFHNTFLEGVKQYGRQYELGLLLRLNLKLSNLKSKDFYSDLLLGMKMMMKRKLTFLPPRSGSKKAMKEIFERAKMLGEGEA